MKLEINLNDETEFLKEIKKFIMDNVKGIARNEFEKQISETFSQKILTNIPKDEILKNKFDNEFNLIIKKLINEALKSSSSSYRSDGNEELRKLIREEISKQVKEMLDKKTF